MAAKKSRGKMAKQHALLHKKKMRKRITLLVVEVIILLALGAVAYAMSKLDKLDFHTIDESKLEIYQDTGNYTNIALFGLDSREGELDGGVRSDAMMVASINNKTGNVKIVSVFRDTLTQQSDGSYEKANAAYSYGGPEEAVALLNRNFDLDIKKYMSVNFNALADVIDLLGGIELDLTDEEVFWTNGYATETSKVVGRKTTELTHAGKQKLDGIQAVSYSRIRYTEGDDFKRSERQRLVLQQVVKEAKKASLPTLNKIINQVLPQVSTNLSTKDFMGIAANAARYELGEMKGYPFDVTVSENVIGLEGSYVVPIGFADNVKQLHAFLFGKEQYQVSDKVQSIDSDIIYLTGVDGNDYEPSADESGSGGTADSYSGDSAGSDTGSTGDGSYDYQDNSGADSSEW
ncbi:MAG: LCP family protein [Muricomes sp.]